MSKINTVTLPPVRHNKPGDEIRLASFAQIRTGQPDPQTVRKCYLRDTGELAEEGQRKFMDWCERMVGEWRERGELLGYVWPFFVVGNVATGTQTYHEWLKERVGL